MHANPAIEKFPINSNGRDFIVGDVHGHFQALSDTLKQRQFNPHRDRVFCVGDLVDRGPSSLEAHQWLAQPWFHSCLGNHEDCLLNRDPADKEGRQWFEKYGGHWWLELDEQQRQPIRAAMSQLPHAIEIETQHGRIGLIHAEIPTGLNWPDFIRLLEAGDNLSLQSSLWGRKRIGSIFSPSIKGIDRVVCGHSVTKDRQVIKKGNIWFIETGAYLAKDGGSLTVLCSDELFSGK